MAGLGAPSAGNVSVAAAMPLDPNAMRFLERLAALDPPSALMLTVDERRGALAALLGFSGPPQPVARVEERTLPGAESTLRARVYTPTDENSALLPGLVYFHGGGLVAGSLESHDGICRALSNASGCRLVAVDYRLAPEHRFPAAIADGCVATYWIAAHAAELGIDAERLMLCGDSAGATLAAVICQRIVAARQVRLAGQVLLCPILDFCAETPSRRDFGEGFLLDEATLEHDLTHYLGPGVDRADPRISPLRASSLDDLPPTCIHTAEYDPLRDEGAAYAARLSLAGVRTLYRCHSGMIHLFYGIGAVIPYAARAYEILGADIRALLQSDSRP
jgi:acetyl esterase/lipase